MQNLNSSNNQTIKHSQTIEPYTNSWMRGHGLERKQRRASSEELQEGREEEAEIAEKLIQRAETTPPRERES